MEITAMLVHLLFFSSELLIFCTTLYQGTGQISETHAFYYTVGYYIMGK